MSESRGASSLMFFLAGLAVGAVTGLLLAPQAGEETRRYVTQKTEGGKEYLAGRGKRARHQAEEWVSKGKRLLNKGRERFTGAVAAGKQAYYANLGR